MRFRAPRSAKARAKWRGSCHGAPFTGSWQMLLKGLQDVAVAPDPREAAEMTLLRVIHQPTCRIPRLSWQARW